MYFYPASPATLVTTLASTWGHSPTQVSPVSVPAFPPTALVQLSTQASPVSFPSSRLPAIPLYPPLVPTAWLSFTVASNSLLPAKFLPGLPKLFICRPLAPPRLSPATAPLISCLTCAHFKYRSQIYPLGHGCLSSWIHLVKNKNKYIWILQLSYYWELRAPQTSIIEVLAKSFSDSILYHLKQNIGRCYHRVITNTSTISITWASLFIK